MNAPQIILAPNGDEMVVLPRADFETLLNAANLAAEDADDAAMFDARMAELNAGADTRLPPAVSADMIKGASLLAALRKWRGITQQQLADSSGVGQGYISDLEARRRKGTATTLAALATALDVPQEWLAG